MPEYIRNNREHLNLKHEKRRIELKEKVLTHYSGGRCVCVECGFSDLDCLSIDHINGGGKEHRRVIGVSNGIGMYSWLINNNYPEGYQTLCMNCQFKKKMVEKEHWRGKE